MDGTEHVTAGAIAWRLTAVMVLVALNAFFVAAEFAIVGVRSQRGRLDQQAADGDRSARRILVVMDRIDLYISSAQLGITLASLALGWIGEPALAALADRGFALLGVNVPPGAAHTTAAIITSFLVITFLHITLGEQTPKSLGIVSPEKVARFTTLPLMLFTRLMKPFIWVLNAANNLIMRTLGIPDMGGEGHSHSREDLRLFAVQARASGTLDESDSQMLAGVFDFHDKKARDVMRPRTDVVGIEIEFTEQEVLELIRTERYSRYPVYRDSLDDVVGVLLAMDLFLDQKAAPFDMQRFMREPLYVPDSRPAERVLDDLRRTRAHMAVVLDEYGGTAGILTMEDLIEEVVGDISDEYDQALRDSVETDGVLELAGAMSLIDVRSNYHVAIPDGDWTTLGGFTFAHIGRLPTLGDRVKVPGGELEVVAMDGRRVAALRVHRTPAPALVR